MQVQDLIHPSLCECHQYESSHALISPCSQIRMSMASRVFVIIRTHWPPLFVQRARRLSLAFPYSMPQVVIRSFLAMRACGTIATMRGGLITVDEGDLNIDLFNRLPSVFEILDDGSVFIASRINGLGTRSEFPVLYETLERVFSLGLPMVEHSMCQEYAHKESTSFRRWKARCHIYDRAEYEKVLTEQAREKQKERRDAEHAETLKQEEIRRELAGEPLGGLPVPSRLLGRSLKVIVKASPKSYSREPSS